MESDKKELTPLEALQVALKKEKAACDFYKQYAEKVDHPGAKKMFEFLAKEEIKHQEMIQDEIDKGFFREM